MTESIAQTIRGMVAEILEMDLNQVQPENTIGQIAAADSVVLLEILVALERKFHIEIQEREVKTVATLQDLIRLVESKLPQAG